MRETELYAELMRKIRTYLTDSSIEMVDRAYKMARNAHGEKQQLRKSGEPYIIHPLSVALILSELEMDAESICAGILHDVIEDTHYSYVDIEKLFNTDIAQIVDGVTKLTNLPYISREEVQAENYRKMFVAMARDIRVLVIKIADRLHNMRTLNFMPPDKQRKTAQETLDIYAPLANRLGISKIKNELEDLCFKYLFPEEFADLRHKIRTKQNERIEYVEQIVEQLKKRVKEHGIANFIVEGRPKHLFSIYMKMVSQNKNLDQIYDIFAVRVIVESLRECYEVLGIIHEMYTPIPGRFKDYIALPKANKYQSIHNTLIGPGGEPFEIQIRTKEMHRTAEYGIAAHWRYKQGASAASAYEEDRLSWLRQILDWQKEMQDNREYLDAIKLDLNVFHEQVYCFTPKGQVISLVAGATPIDFAYAIHSAIGSAMIGAKVDGRIVNLDYVLQTGERVEILTSSSSRGPSRDWLKIVKTSQARNKINQWFKKENKEEYIQKGREVLEKGAKRLGLLLTDLATPGGIAAVLDRYSIKDFDAVCAAIGLGSLKERQVLNRLHEEYLRTNGTAELTDAEALKQMSEQTQPETKKKGGSGIVVKGIGDVSVRFSRCCSPVPGDEIVGFVTRGRGLSIHRKDCSNIVHLPELEKHRLIDAVWHIPARTDGGPSFRADLHLQAADRNGLLVDVSRVFDSEKINISAINLRTVKMGVIIDVSITITGKDQLAKVIDRLKRITGIHEIERISV